MKKCNKCGLDKPIEHFGKHDWCKLCKAAYNKKWKNNNKDKVNNYQKKYSEKNKEYYKTYYSKNKETLSEKSKKYNSKKNEVAKVRGKLDLNFKIKRNLRSRLQTAVKRVMSRKVDHSDQLLGCTIYEFRKHLESKFLPTMTFDNYGSLWHIDHIIPCAHFNLIIEEEQRKCFHYSNLQPLFAVTTIINNIEYVGNLNKNDRL